MNLINSYDTVDVVEILVDNGPVTGIRMEVPGAPAKQLEVRCNHGVLACGFFNLEAMDAHNVAVAIISAPDLPEMMENKPKALSSKAIEMGATMDMTGFEIAALFNK